MKRGTKIIRNAIRCKTCGEVIESKHVHDWVCCTCWKESNGKRGCFIDGGHEYCRVGGDINKIDILSETRPYTDDEVDEYNRRQEQLAKDYDFVKPNYMEKD